MNTEISLFNRFGMQAPATVTYSPSINAFVGKGYTSMPGNTYFNAARFADGILIKEDIGEGYVYTFLNGIHIYDLKTKKMLCEKYFHCCKYSKGTVREYAKEMLMDLIESAAKSEGIMIDELDAKCRIGDIVDQAFATNQIDMLKTHSKVLEA